MYICIIAQKNYALYNVTGATTLMICAKMGVKCKMLLFCLNTLEMDTYCRASPWSRNSLDHDTEMHS